MVEDFSTPAVLHGAIIHDANFFRVELGGDARFLDALSFYVRAFLSTSRSADGQIQESFSGYVRCFPGNVESPVNKGSGELCQTGRIDTFRI